MLHWILAAVVVCAVPSGGVQVRIVRGDLLPLQDNSTDTHPPTHRYPVLLDAPAPGMHALASRYNRLRAADLAPSRTQRNTPQGEHTRSAYAGEEYTAGMHAGFGRVRRGSELVLIGYPSTAYSVLMGVGTPTQQAACVVDTGSSNLALAAKQQGALRSWVNLDESTTVEREGTSFSVEYVSASFTAERVKDYVSFLGYPTKMTEKVEFGAIVSSKNFFETGTLYQGILGLAYGALAMPVDNPVIPYLDSFVSFTHIPNLVCMELCDVKDKDNVAGGYGRMALGELLPGRMNGTLYYSPLKTHTFYTVMVTRVNVGDEIIDLPCSEYNSPGYSIVDSGTTDLLVPAALHKKLVQIIDDAIENLSPGSLGDSSEKKSFYSGETCSYALTDDIVLALPPIIIAVESSNGANMELELKTHPWHYLRAYTDSKAKQVCRKFAVIPHCSPGSGMVLGIAFLANFVAVFDRANHRMGFVTSACSGFYTSTGAEIHVDPISPPMVRRTNDTCTPNTSFKCPNVSKPTNILIYVAIGAGSCAVVMAGIVAYMFLSQRRERTQGRHYNELSNFADPEGSDDEPGDARNRQHFQDPPLIMSDFEDDAMLIP